MIDHKILKEAATTILKNMPNKPFLCLPMSALLYAMLKDNHQTETKIVTGNLAFNGFQVFKQDFSIVGCSDQNLRYWSGHAWVEADEFICDLSIFRTLYSDDFDKSCKQEMIQAFGKGRGLLAASRNKMQELGLTYLGIEILSDEIATGIIKGIEKLPIYHD